MIQICSLSLGFHTLSHTINGWKWEAIKGWDEIVFKGTIFISLPSPSLNAALCWWKPTNADTQTYMCAHRHKDTHAHTREIDENRWRMDRKQTNNQAKMTKHLDIWPHQCNTYTLRKRHKLGRKTLFHHTYVHMCQTFNSLPTGD